MATTYRLFLLDEFDWEYVGRNRRATCEKITASPTNYSIITEATGLIVVDIHKDTPEDALLKMRQSGLVWDAAYSQENNECDIRPIINIFNRSDALPQNTVIA